MRVHLAGRWRARFERPSHLGSGNPQAPQPQAGSPARYQVRYGTGSGYRYTLHPPGTGTVGRVPVRVGGLLLVQVGFRIMGTGYPVQVPGTVTVQIRVGLQSSWAACSRNWMHPGLKALCSVRILRRHAVQQCRQIVCRLYAVGM